MGLLQPYIGRYVSAPSASEVLDAQAVFDGCDAVEKSNSADVTSFSAVLLCLIIVSSFPSNV